jgi:LacI family transcriptional regulator
MNTGPTVRELASRLGVSRTTVSLALRNDPRSKKETRLRVQKLAESLGYRRNALVTTLMTQVQARRVRFNGEVLAFITALNEEFYWKKQSEGSVFAGAREMADKLGFRLEPFWTGPAGVNSRRVARVLRARGVRGMLIPYMPIGLEPLELDWEHLPVVATGYSFRQKNPHRVAANQFQTSMLCYEKLHEMGHKRIGMALGVASDVRVNHYWASAFLGAQHRLKGAPIKPFDVAGVPEHDAFMRWFERYRPDALMVALWRNSAQEWLEARGIKVPQDVSIAHLDVAEKDQGRLSGINQNHPLVGAGAISLLASLIFRNEAGLPQHPTVTNTEVTWLDGATSLPRRRANARLPS